ncbi:MAG: histidine kinase [Microthrixaceae bacterium]
MAAGGSAAAQPTPGCAAQRQPGPYQRTGPRQRVAARGRSQPHAGAGALWRAGRARPRRAQHRPVLHLRADAGAAQNPGQPARQPRHSRPDDAPGRGRAHRRRHRRPARASGFPEHHPHMRSLVGVPIMAKGRIFGNLYLADKRVESGTGAVVVDSFTAEEQEILQMFAAQAAIAIENAQLYKENQQLAILRERDRIGMDLHDGVIQSLYAIGLLLDDARHRLDSDPEKTRATLGTAIAGLNNTIQDIRNYISDLRPHRFQGRNVRQGLEQLAQELRTDTLFAVHLKVDPQAAAACTARQADEFLHIAQEALANIRKHADATTIQMRFQFSDGLLQMVIQDDGSGFDPIIAAGAARRAGAGCATCVRRARRRRTRCTANFASKQRPGFPAHK